MPGAAYNLSAGRIIATLQALSDLVTNRSDIPNSGGNYQLNLLGALSPGLDLPGLQIPDDSIYMLEVCVSGARDNGNDGYAFRILTTVKNNGGVLSIVGTNDITGGGDGGAAGATADVVVSGGASLMLEVDSHGVGSYSSNIQVRILTKTTIV